MTPVTCAAYSTGIEQDGKASPHLQGAFVPSLHLPPGRILEARAVSVALSQLRRAFGLPPPGTPAIRRVNSGASVPPDEWPEWLIRLMPDLTIIAAQSQADAHAAAWAEQRQIGLDDVFEHKFALNWLQRIVSSKVHVQSDESDDGLSSDPLIDWAAELLACAAGKAASGPETTTYCFSVERNETEPQEVPVTVHDMSLVDDALGGRTWGAAPLLAWELLHRLESPGNVLELGAGTGLVGLALAAQAATKLDKEDATASTHIILTDHHPTVLSNLEYNVSLWHLDHPKPCGVQITTSSLDWYEVYAASAGIGGGHPDGAATSRSTSAQTLPCTPQETSAGPATPSTTATNPNATPSLRPDSILAPASFSVIIAADCVYDPAHPVWIRAVAHKFLSRTLEARLHLISPLRETHRDEIEALMATFPTVANPAAEPQLVLHHAVVLYGQDDFGGASRAQRQHDQTGANRVYLRIEVGWSG